MQIAIYGRKFGKQFTTFADTFFKQLKKNNIQISIYEPFYNFILSNTEIDPKPARLFTSYDDLARDCDFVFSIGGDGTILETVTLVRDSGIPVLGINSGRLGFLANISREDIDNAVETLLAGKYSIEKRSLLHLESPEGLFRNFNFALNEFTVQKRDYTMITIQAWVNDQFLNAYWADGLIISTPTGSTAYSLSVGGPILSFDTRGFIISPIAPHNLTVRPLVIPDCNTIRLKVQSRNNEFLLSMDQQYAILPAEKEIILKKSDFDISLVRLDNQDFYTTLRSKLMWGADKRN